MAPFGNRKKLHELAVPAITAVREHQANLQQSQEELIRLLVAYEEEQAYLVQEHGEEKDRLRADVKYQLEKEWEEKRAISERTQAAETAAMEREMAEFRAECERLMAEEKAGMQKTMAESRAECERMFQEKAGMARQLAEFRAECECRMAEEKAEMMNKMAEFRAACEVKIVEEKMAMEEQLAEARRLTEAQLQSERQITDHIRHAMRELPPLQGAMELGDLGLLEVELKKWKPDVITERFGESKGVVEAVVKLAQERLITWRGVEKAMKDVLKEVERLPNSVPALVEHCQRIFRTLKEAQLTKLDLRRSGPRVMERISEVFLTWSEHTCCYPNGVHRAIIRKAITCSQLGPFDFTDLDICLRLVDRAERGSEAFLSRAKVLVEDETTQPKDLRPLLSHVETMLFFLKYTKSEDLRLTHAEFRKQASRLDRSVAGYLARAEREYPAGAELVRLSEGRELLNDDEVSAVLEEIKRPSGKDNLGIFRDIFYQWALVMRNRFDLLVLPHHTQVVCLLVFRSFLEAQLTGADPHALIAQVGTGEGKSMIIAALVLYVVCVLRKKAHVVVDDETLLERDFWTFKPLFDAFEVSDGPGRPARRVVAKLCVPEERLGHASVVARVDPDADVVYGEAKHVQSFYASIARGEKRDFAGYDGRVLILDEVDALIIDEEPNEAFVYPNTELNQMATRIAEALEGGASVEHISPLRSGHPAAQRVLREMSSEWTRGKQLQASDDFVYVKELGRYCLLQGGRANPKTWSLALECRNFQDGLTREIVYQERLFVMSRPRVFRKYHRILGLSGSIGSEAERRFLQTTYRAAFLEVPPFLKTCRSDRGVSPFHEAVPVCLGSQRRAAYVEPTPEAQLARLAEVAFEARDNVPVLVIAKDRAQCDQLVERLRHAARSRGFGHASEDIVRSLSRTLCETDPEQWKDNLNRSTMPLGEGSGGSKSWRVTVTDPRGGRGTDYRVDDRSVDERGGLLLIPTIVPNSQREWIQFLGRTARQDRRGQFCTVLCETDYRSLSAKYGQVLPAGGGLEVVEAIISWGDREIAERIRGSAALYNCGVRVNELCEEIFGRRPELLRDSHAREVLVDICQRYRWMSLREIDEAFARVPSFAPAKVLTEARDLGRPAEPPASQKSLADVANPRNRVGSRDPSVPKVVIFCLDWSLSMLSQDTGTSLSRFGTCVACVRRILHEQVRDRDLVGVVGFGNKVETVVAPTPKERGGNKLDARIASLQAQTLGGTCFFDAVATCLQLLGQPGLAQVEAPRWLVCLTDGDDLGSRRENAQGEVVTRMLEDGLVSNLNMVMITVGKLKDKNLRVIDSWVEQVTQQGGLGRHLSEQNAAAISLAFSVVAECLAAEVGGATEC